MPDNRPRGKNRRGTIELSIIEEKFVNEFMIDFQPKAAAIRAGYQEKSAASTAYHLLNRPDIADRIQYLRERMVAKFEVDRDMIVSELAKIAFADPRNFFDERGNMKEIYELDDISAASLMGLEIEELFAGNGNNRIKIGQIKKLKRWDKVKALDVLCKIFGYYAPIKVDPTTPTTLTDDQFNKLLIAANATKNDPGE
jgi:phage terminase small subunit